VVGREPRQGRFIVDIDDSNAYIDGMATINIRNLPDDIHRRLRVRAARAGRSMEAEAREIIARACMQERVADVAALQAWVDSLYRGRKPRRVVEDLIAERRKESKRER
jgi:plasmid stability protein